jgi:hypothetical protein
MVDKKRYIKTGTNIFKDVALEKCGKVCRFQALQFSGCTVSHTFELLNSVTRFFEVSLVGRLFTLGSFFKLT